MFFSKFNKLVEQRKNENGVAMIFALTLMLIGLALVFIMVNFALVNVAVTQTINAGSRNDAAAETAISDAVSTANTSASGLDAYDCADNYSFSTTDKKGLLRNKIADGSSIVTNWTWCSDKVATSGNRIFYYIYATGYRDTPTEKTATNLRATLQSNVYDVGAYCGGPTDKVVEGVNCGAQRGVIYTSLSAQSAFQWGVYAVNNVSTKDGYRMKSYDSSQGEPTSSTNVATISANFGPLVVGSNSGLNRYIRFGEGETRAGECTPAANCTGVSVIDQTFAYSLSGVTSKVNSACTSPVAWVSSANNGILNSGCYSSLDFDRDTTITSSASADNPVVAYVKGNITVRPGFEINVDKTPTALQIYTAGAVTLSMLNGTPSTDVTTFEGLIAGENMTCNIGDKTDGSDAAGLKVYGGLACDTIRFGSRVEMWMDEAAANTKVSSNNSRIWSPVAYETVARPIK